MLINIPKTTKWLLPHQAKALVPESIRATILSSSSLTLFLSQKFPNTFRVKVISNTLQKVPVSECSLIKTQPQEQVLVREVFLEGAGRPLVYAQTSIPKSTLQSHHKLLTLGSSSIGSLLFASNKNKREKMKIAQMKLIDIPADFGAVFNKKTTTTWARQSLFLLDKSPLVVTEFFLPTFENTQTLLL